MNRDSARGFLAAVGVLTLLLIFWNLLIPEIEAFQLATTCITVAVLISAVGASFRSK